VATFTTSAGVIRSDTALSLRVGLLEAQGQSLRGAPACRNGGLDVGRRGVYPVDRIARLSAERVSRFFTRSQSGDPKTVTVRPELARLVTFRQINLLSPIWPTEGRFDAVFCRNVMIYFDKPTQAGILRRFVPLMHPDALLFVGHSESLFHVADAFRLKGRTVYELTGRRAAA
jgi:chemotaxis protein methyltransferase CheR